METGDSVTDATFKDTVLKALADEYSRAIIACTMDKSKSVIDISTECNIPISTAYRRVHELEEAGLLRVHGSIVSSDGKRYYLYRSKIKAVRMIFGLDSLNMEVMRNDEMGRSAYW
ncbi:MAG: ArsR/SmtB family transcription factor [Nitrososphaerales archaeon]